MKHRTKKHHEGGRKRGHKGLKIKGGFKAMKHKKVHKKVHKK